MLDHADVASPGVAPKRSSHWSNRARTLWWVTATPFGRPVDPDV